MAQTKEKAEEKVAEVTATAVDLEALAAAIAAEEEEEAVILAKAEEIRKKKAEKQAAVRAASEPIIAPYRPNIEALQGTLATLGTAHKAAMDALREQHAAERAGVEADLESILVELESKGVSRDHVLPKKGGGATGKRGPGVKAAALGSVGSASDPIVVTAPRRRVGDGVPETHNYYSDGINFYGQMGDGSWSESPRLSEVSSSHGWHDTKDVAAAMSFAAGKPYGPMAHPGAVFCNGSMVPTGAVTAESEVESV
jgi:hypothetical protein